MVSSLRYLQGCEFLSKKLGFDKSGTPLVLTNLFDGERSHVFTTTTTTTKKKTSPRFGKDSRESYIQIHVHRKLHAHVSKMSDEDGKFDRFMQFALVILYWIH